MEFTGQLQLIKPFLANQVIVKFDRKNVIISHSGVFDGRAWANLFGSVHEL